MDLVVYSSRIPITVTASTPATDTVISDYLTLPSHHRPRPWRTLASKQQATIPRNAGESRRHATMHKNNHTSAEDQITEAGMDSSSKRSDKQVDVGKIKKT